MPCQLFSDQEKRPLRTGGGVWEEFGLLPATEDQSESTKAEKGGGRRLGHGFDQQAVKGRVGSRRLSCREDDRPRTVRGYAEEGVERATHASGTSSVRGRSIRHIACHAVGVLDGIKTRTPAVGNRVEVVGQPGSEPSDGNRGVVEPKIGRDGIDKLGRGAATVRAQADPVVFTSGVAAAARNRDTDTCQRITIKVVNRVESASRAIVEPVITCGVGRGATVRSNSDLRASDNRRSRCATA